MRKRIRREDVLNEALYFRLQSLFGTVKVINPGEAMIARVSRDFVSDDLRLHVEQAGEYYLISCPYCTDTRFRLYVSHRFGTRDEAGRVMNYAAICYNEGCLQELKNREHFVFALNEIPGVLTRARIKKGVVLPAEARKKAMPGRCLPVQTLPATHPANSYLISRGFDPVLLGEFYGVSYCTESIYFSAIKRLIVPVFMHDNLVGWQGRYVGELPWKHPDKKAKCPPKYFTCPGMDKRFILGNFDVARRFHTGVLVEGWFDVFNVGPMAMCMFGHSLSTYQQREFVAAFAKRSGVYMVDPEEFDKPATQATIRQLRDALSGNLVAVKLPRGTDPGKLSRPYLRNYMEVTAKKQGVALSWQRIS